MAKRKDQGTRGTTNEIGDTITDVKPDDGSPVELPVEDSSSSTIQVDYEIPVIKKRRRRRVKPSESDDTAKLITNVLDVIGNALAGEAGKLNATERALILTGLSKLELDERITRISYPLIGVIGVLMWGLRVYTASRPVLMNNDSTNAKVEPESEPTIIPSDSRLHSTVSRPV